MPNDKDASTQPSPAERMSFQHDRANQYPSDPDRPVLVRDDSQPAVEADCGSEITAERYFQLFLKEVESFLPLAAGQVWGLNAIGQLAKIASNNPRLFQKLEHQTVVAQHRSLLSEVLTAGRTRQLNEKTAASASDGLMLLLEPLCLNEQPIGVVEMLLAAPPDADRQSRLRQLVRQAESYLQQQAMRPLHTKPGNMPPPSRAPAGRESHGNLGALHSNRIRFQQSNPADASVDPISDHPFADLPQAIPAGADQRQAEPSCTRPWHVEPPLADLAESENGQSSYSDVDEFIRLLHTQTDLEYVAFTAVNETRRLLDCDRVALIIRRGGANKLAAVSGQSQIDRRSNLSRIMCQLAGRVVQTERELRRDTIAETGSDTSRNESAAAGYDDWGTDFQSEVADYLQASRASWFRMVPLYGPQAIDFESPMQQANNPPSGVLIVENFSSRPTPADWLLDRLRVHIGLAVFHAIQLEEIFLHALRRRVGECWRLAKMTPAKLLALCTAIGLLAAACIWIERPYYVTATGTLTPVKQFRAFAPFDGKVNSVAVQSGEQVQPSQLLVSVHSESLSTQALILKNDLAGKQKQLEALRAQQSDRSFPQTSADPILLNADIAQTELEVQGLSERLKLIDSLISQSQIRTPIRGSVSTFRPQELLGGRPVNRGDLLLEVMDESGDWQLELMVPEKRIGHLLNGDESDRPRPLPIKFIQATSPDVQHSAHVTQISKRVLRTDDTLAVVQVTGGIDKSAGLNPTIGAEIIAKIECGEKCLGYIWFGDLIEWTSKTFW